MPDVGTAWVNVVPSAKGFGRETRKAIAPQVEQLGTEMGQKMGQKMGQEGGKAASKGIGDKLRSGLSNVATGVALGVGAAIGTKILDGIGSAVSGGINRLLNLEDANKRLEQMGLSTADIDSLMADLNKTLEGTPIALDAGTTALANLVSAGFDLEDIPGIMEDITDAAAFGQADFGEVASIFQRIGTNGKLSALELEMLQDRGIPALSLLSDAAGVTESAFRDMISENQISSEEFFDLWDQGAKGFGDNNIQMEGAAKSMGDTTRGSFENLKTALSRFTAEVLEPIFNKAQGLFTSLTGWIDDAKVKWQEWTDSIDWGETWDKVTGAASDAFAELEDVVKPLTDLLEDVDWEQLWKDIQTGADNLKEALGKVDWKGMWEKLKPVLTEISDNLAELFNDIDDFVKEVWPSFRDAWVEAWPIIKVVAAVLGVVLLGALKSVSGQLRNTAMMMRIFAGNLTMALDLASASMHFFTTNVSWAWNTVIKPVWEAMSSFVTTTLVPAFSSLWTAASSVFQNLSAIVSAVWAFLQPIFSAIASAVVNGLAGAFRWLQTTAQNAWSGLSSAVSNAWAFIQTIFTAIREALSGLSTFISDRIQDIQGFFSGLASGISDALSGVKDAILGPFEDAFNAIKSVWDNTVGKLKMPNLPGLAGSALNIPGFHTGGVVPGRAGAEVFAVLQAGEVVLNREQVGHAYRNLQGAAAMASPAAAPQVVVPMYINGKRFAQATSTDMGVEADRQRKMRGGG